MGEWLTRPAVADVAINKILANGTVVAGRGATFVNVHFAEIPHEACRTAGETHHILNASWPSRNCRVPPAGPAEWIWKNILFSIIYQKVQLFPPLFFFHSVAPSCFWVVGRKRQSLRDSTEESVKREIKFKGAHVHPTLNPSVIRWPFPTFTFKAQSLW